MGPHCRGNGVDVFGIVRSVWDRRIPGECRGSQVRANHGECHCPAVGLRKSVAIGCARVPSGVPARPVAQIHRVRGGSIGTGQDVPGCSKRSLARLCRHRWACIRFHRKQRRAFVSDYWKQGCLASERGFVAPREQTWLYGRHSCVVSARFADGEVDVHDDAIA
jgi:hypothetical protein